jgi:hypothetical protein
LAGRCSKLIQCRSTPPSARRKLACPAPTSNLPGLIVSNSRLRDAFGMERCFLVRGHFTPCSIAVFASAIRCCACSSTSILDGGCVLICARNYRAEGTLNCHGRTNSTQRSTCPLGRIATSTVTQESRTQHANGVAAIAQRGLMRSKQWLSLTYARPFGFVLERAS